MQITQAKALKNSGFIGLFGLLLSLLLGSSGQAQVIEFLPGAPSVYEAGGTAGTNISIIVTRTPATGTSVVQYATFDGSAIAGSDYTATNDVLTFLDGETFKIISVPILDDAVPEPAETFGVTLFNATGGTLGSNAVATVTIFDNDTVFSFIPGTNYVVQEDGTNIVLTVERVGDITGSASVDFFTQDGTAVSGLAGDYVTTSGTLLFSNGQSTATITVPINDDCNVETNIEVFLVKLSNPIGGTVSSVAGTAIVRIIDNDTTAGRITITRATIPPGDPDFFTDPLQPFVREGNTTTVTIHVARECGTAGTITVDIDWPDISTCPGGDAARAGSDFTVSPTSLTFPSGSANEQTFNITILRDNFVELDELTSFTLVRLRIDGVLANAYGPVRTIPLVIRSSEFAAGSVDPFYNTIITPGANSEVYAVSVVTNSLAGNNGKTILVGDFTGVNATVRNRIARVFQNGSIDPSFDPGSGADGFVDTVAQQPDGRILVAGGFTSVNNISRVGVARLNEDGTLDDTFQPGGGVRGTVYAMALQNDGRIIIAGDFTAYNDTAILNLARLLPNGDLDPTFSPGTGPNGAIWSLAVLENGPRMVYVGGDFTVFDGKSRSRIARLNDNGGVDAAFAPAFGADDTVYALGLQRDSSIILGGAFQTFDGNLRPGLVRLTPAGIVDPTFFTGSGLDGVVYDIKFQANDMPIIVGSFNLYNGTARTNVARLYANGILDTSFMDVQYNQKQPGTDGFVNSVSLQADGNVIIGGFFTTVGGGSDYIGIGGMLTNAIRAQFNYTRLVGGVNPPAQNMPGNVEFTSATYSVDENSLSGNVIITIRRINGTVEPLWINYYTVDGTATDGVDYIATSGTVTFPDCSLGTAAFTINVTDNQLVQGNRTFSVILTNAFSIGGVAPAYPALGGVTKATVTIVDNDFNHGAIGFSQPVFVVDEFGTNAVITVTRTNGSVGQVSVQYATYDITASTTVNDYSPVSGTLTFASGQTNKTITVPIVNDLSVEPEEWFGVRLTNITGGATYALSNATVLIYDNDNGRGSVSLATSGFFVSESGTNAAITLRRTSGGVGSLSVDFLAYELPLGPGVARADIDFTAITNRVVFPPGSTQQVVLVPITADRFVEGNEAVGLALANVTNGTLGFLSTGTLTIVDDDAYGAIGFTDVNAFVSERGTNLTVTLVRTGGDAEAVSVDYTTTPLSATDGSDYAGTNGTVTFPDGVRTATFSIPITDDDLLEGNETFRIGLGNFQKASPGGITNLLVTITDDEALHVPAGSVDTTFDADPNSFVNAVGLQSDGKLIIGGDFTSIEHFGFSRIARLDVTGGPDPLFRVGLGANDQVQCLLVQGDDKILIGGRFTSYDMTNRARIARLNADGTIDSSFNPGAGADNPVFAMALLTDKRIVIGGSFTTVNGVNRPNVALLNTNGAVDTTFSTGAGLNGTVYAIAVQPDGKILVGGDFTVVNNTNRTRIARLNPNGSLDLSFNPGAGPSAAVRSIVVQPDGNILLGGSFTSVNGASRNYIARLLPGGAMDPLFDAGSAADAAVLAMVLQPNGKIIAVGDFHVFNGVHRNRITRLNPDGSIDPTINFGTGANAFIAAVLVQANEEIIIGGGFTEFNETPRHSVARLVGGENSGAGSFNFVAPQFTVNENGTNALITILRTGGTAGTGTVHFTTYDGTAVAPIHYISNSVTLVFPPGETLQTVNVAINNNTTVDGDQILYLQLNNPTPAEAEVGLIGDAALLIREDDSVISFSTASYSVNEGVVGGHATISVVRTGSTNSAVAAYFSTLPGSATPDLDYADTNVLVVFAPGDTVRDVTVSVLNDTESESPESVRLYLANPQILSSAPSSVYLGLSNATLTIVDNDFLPGEFTFTTTTNYIDEFTPVMTVTVLRTNGNSGLVSVRASLSDGTAVSPADYFASSVVLSFADGETVKTFSFLVVNDNLVEGDETINMALSNPTGGATLGAITNAVTVIIDDESGIQFVPVTYGAAEDDGTVRLTVVRSGNTNVTASVNFETAGGTATSGVDFLANSGTLNFPPGVVNRFIDVTLVPDNITETNERFTVILENPSSNVQLGTGSVATVTIQDSARFVSFNTNKFSVNESDTNAVITLHRNGLLSRAISVWLRTRPDTAVEGADYVAYSNIVKFAAGESNKTVLIPIIDDGLTEQPETLFLDLLYPTNAAVGFPGTAVLTISDNDPGAGFADTGFNVGLGANKFVRSLAVQADGRILVGGAFTNFAGATNRNFLARVLTNGVYDTSFDPGTNLNGLVSSIAYSADNRIVIGGAFTNLTGSPLGRLAKLLTNGSPDPLFSAASRFDAAINSVWVQADNRIVAGGAFSTPSRGVARIRINGTPDLAFDVGSGADSVVHSVCTLADGTILAGGGFTNFGGFNYPRLVRLGPAGQVDVTMAPLSITNGVIYSAIKTAGGKILIGGSFRSVNGVARAGVARLNWDGTLDASFNPGTGANGNVYTVAALADGRIFVGGDFTAINDIPRNRYALLEVDGTVDVEFDSTVGADNTVYCSVVQPDQKIVIGGDFSAVSGVQSRGVARLNTVPLRIDPPVFVGGDAEFTVYASPGLAYVLEASTNMVYWSALSTNTASGTTLIITDPDASSSAYRFYRLRRIVP